MLEAKAPDYIPASILNPTKRTRPSGILEIAYEDGVIAWVDPTADEEQQIGQTQTHFPDGSMHFEHSDENGVPVFFEEGF